MCARPPLAPSTPPLSAFPRPIGSAIPDPYFTQLAALDPRALDVTGSVPLPRRRSSLQVVAPTYDFPVVERRLKGDRLTLTKVPQPPGAGEVTRREAAEAEGPSGPDPGVKPTPRPVGPPPIEAQQAPAPVARKGDRAPATTPAKVEKPVATPAGDGSLNRAAIAAEQIAQGASAAGSVPRKPAAIAEKPAPVERPQVPSVPVRKAEKPKPVATPSQDAALQRAGRAAEKAAQSTQAAQAAASAPKKPTPVAENLARRKRPWRRSPPMQTPRLRKRSRRQGLRSKSPISNSNAPTCMAR